MFFLGSKASLILEEKREEKSEKIKGEQKGVKNW
jgi:hypothetical protein